METEILKQTKKHFSRLGLMYFLGTILTYIVQYVISFVVIKLKPELYESTNAAMLLSMLPMYIIAIPIMILLITKFVPAVKPARRRMSGKQWITAFFMCYAIMYLSNLIGQAITMVVGAIKGSAVQNMIVDIAFDLNPFISIFLMVLCAPVIEELIFRKLLIDRTVRYGEGVAVFFSGLMFGLFHGNLNQFAYAFTLGVFFGFIYVKTGDIRYTVLMHMLINFLSSVVAMLLMKNSGYSELAGAMNDPAAMSAILMEHLPQLLLFVVYIFLMLAAVITGIILLIVKSKQFVLYSGEIEIPRGKRFSTTILNLGMLLFCGFWLVMILIQLFR